jgi:alanine transaminase
MTKPRQEPTAEPQTNGYKKVLTVENINPAVVHAEYAVRGELALRANVLTEQLNKNGQGDLPFSDVVHCEIGNPQALDQKPLSFIRQVRPSWEYVPDCRFLR